MAPILPVSRKRLSPSNSGDDEVTEEPNLKRRRLECTPLFTPPPDVTKNAHSITHHMFNDNARRLLQRSVALILEHVGFAGASPEALEALCAEVDTYAEHFLAQVVTSMLIARRSLPIPLDFKYALTRWDLPLLSLGPHLTPPIPAYRYHVELDEAPGPETDVASLDALLGGELSGEADKKEKSYIPKCFPAFPSKHTYKWTERQPARITDPRKIREEAAKSARFGEEALRKLANISKSAKEKSLKAAADKDPRSKDRHELWEKAMEQLGGQSPGSAIGDNDGEEKARSMIVNAEQQYWRKSALKRRAQASKETIGDALI